MRFDRLLGDLDERGLGESGEPPVPGQAVHAVRELIDPAVCGGPFQHGRDVAGLCLQPGRGAGAVAAADLASGHGGELGVVADRLVQVGWVGRMGGGDVLADRGQGAQPVTLAERQPELPQHGRRGQPGARQQRGQVLAGNTVGEHAQQAQQPRRRGGHQRRGDRGLHRDRDAQFPAGPAHPGQHPGPLGPPPLRDLGQIGLALGGIAHQLHRQRHPVQLRQQLIQPRVGRETRPGHGQEQPPRLSQRQRAQHGEIPPPQPRRAARPPRGDRHRGLRDRGYHPQQLLDRQRVRRPRRLEIIQHHHRQPRAQRGAHPIGHAARWPVADHPQLGGQPRQQRPGRRGAVAADEPPPVPEPLGHPLVVQRRQADRALADPRRAQHRHRLRRRGQPRLHQRGDLAVPADQIRPRRKPRRATGRGWRVSRGRVSCSACSSNSSSCSGLANLPAITPASSSRARNARCRTCRAGSSSSSRPGGIGTAASSSSRKTSRGSPASVAAWNSSSVYDTSGWSRTGEPYRSPISPT